MNLSEAAVTCEASDVISQQRQQTGFTGVKQASEHDQSVLSKERTAAHKPGSGVDQFVQSAQC